MIIQGDHDVETFENVMKHMNRSFMEIQAYMKIKSNGETDGYDGTTEASNGENGSLIDLGGETHGNNYGSAGSSAGMSDSKVLRMKPPEEKGSTGRPITAGINYTLT